MKMIPGLALATVLLAGCEESPTSLRTEQSVFAALGGLAEGESMVFTGADAERVLLGGLPSAGSFLYVPFHASEGEGTLQLELSGTNIEVDGPSLLLGPRAEEVAFPPRRMAIGPMHERLHRRLTDQAETLLLGPRLRTSLSPGASSRRPSLSGNNAQVGLMVDLNTDVLGTSCGGVDLRRGRVEAITQHAIVVADTSNPIGGFTRADYEALGQQFDQLVHPTVTRYFSEPTDIDENGRAIIFFTRAVNELTENPAEGFVSGFFYARDLVPRAACTASNEGEVFFMLVPDPDAQASPLRHTRQEVFFDAVAVIGHEYQHLINAGRRFYVNEASALEESWLDEGLSHMVEEMLFYAAADRVPGENLDLSGVVASRRIETAVNQFMVQNLVRYGLYLQEAAEQSPTSGADDLETRGASWAFLRYASDHSELTDEQFLRLLVNGPQTGMDNLRNVVSVDPLEMLRRWGVSNYTDDLVNSADRMYRQPSWNYRSLLPVLFGRYPLDPQALGGTPMNLTITAGSSGFILVRGIPDTVSRVSASSGGAAPSSQLRVTVVRTM